MVKILRTLGLGLVMLTQLHCTPVERKSAVAIETNTPSTKRIEIVYGLYNSQGQLIKKVSYAKGNLSKNIDTNNLANECKFKLNLPPIGCEYKP